MASSLNETSLTVPRVGAAAPSGAGGSGPAAFERAIASLKDRILKGDLEGVQRAAADFPGGPPTPLRLAHLALALAHGTSATAHDDALAALAELRRAHGARSVTRSRSGPDRFAELKTDFESLGSEQPKYSPGLAYFCPSANETIRLQKPLSDVDGAGVALHVFAHVHAGAGDDFYVSILDEDDEKSERMRFASTGLTIERHRFHSEMLGTFPRLFSLVVSGTGFWVFVDGLPLWNSKRREPYRPIAVEIGLCQNPQYSADGILTAFELWQLTGEFSGELVADGGFDDIGELRRAFAEVRPKQVFSLLQSRSGLDLKSLEGDALRFLEELPRRAKGYPDWAAEAVLARLPPEAQQHWRDLSSTVLPPAVIVAEDLGVRLMRNVANSVKITSRARPDDEFAVLDHINFAVYPGDILGIIGHNGAGKSTLLRTIAGLIPIRHGRLRVAEDFLLLRSGIGVRSELTGRQNIISAGVYMGLTPSEAAAMIPDVILFSELGDHIDKPVKYYSDGMMSRLVFSIATSASPDLLLLDELLGAGDISFQEKALQRLHSFISGSKAVVVVTHSIDFVRKHCTKALVLSGGRQVYYGEPSTAVSAYLADRNLSVTTSDAAGHL